MPKRINENKTLKKYFKSEDHTLSQQMINLIMYHNFCSYSKLKDVWLKEIKKGNIHPRDVALFHDNMYRSYECSKPKIPFMNNIFAPYTKEQKKMIKKINEQRAKLFITTLEIDALKKEYEERYGFKFLWGFMNEL